jgi:hypothetical protein
MPPQTLHTAAHLTMCGRTLFVQAIGFEFAEAHLDMAMAEISKFQPDNEGEVTNFATVALLSGARSWAMSLIPCPHLC